MRVYECGKLGANDQPRRSVGAEVEASGFYSPVPARGGIKFPAMRNHVCPAHFATDILAWRLPTDA